jgi:hypothetical protein
METIRSAFGRRDFKAAVWRLKAETLYRWSVPRAMMTPSRNTVRAVSVGASRPCVASGYYSHSLGKSLQA